MKRFLACAVLLSLGLFTLGCGGQSAGPAKKAGTTPTATAKAPSGPATPAAPAPSEKK